MGRLILKGGSWVWAMFGQLVCFIVIGVNIQMADFSLGGLCSVENTELHFVIVTWHALYPMIALCNYKVTQNQY